ncbi:MAG: type 1 glutamine amidotransferase domain-containing protein [Elusimicrobiota bacterium]
MYKNIAVIVTNGFEDIEYTEPVDAFIKEGHRITNIGIRQGEKVRGKKKGTEIMIDKPVQEVDINDYDALLIPGGYSPDKLRVNEKAVKFVRDFVKSNKPVFSICHGPQLLITADVLNGRKATGYKSIKQDIKNAGAEFIDKEVVVDGNMVFSRNPGDLPAFVQESKEKLK